MGIAIAQEINPRIVSPTTSAFINTSRSFRFLPTAGSRPRAAGQTPATKSESRSKPNIKTSAVRLRNTHQDFALEGEFDSFSQRKDRFEMLAESNDPTSTNKNNATSVPVKLNQKADHDILGSAHSRYSARPNIDTVATSKAVNSLGFNSNTLRWITTATGRRLPDA